MSRWLVAFLFAWLAAATAEAKITKIEILTSEPAFGGASFGDTGAYDRLIGRAEGVLDPADPANAIIQDLKLAPRDAQGLVAYSTAIEILRPHYPAKSNHVLFFEVNNRGNKLSVSAFDDGVTGSLADRNNLTSAGDGWLMRQGFTMIWFGWEMDVAAKMGHLGLAPIVAKNADGSPLTGIVRDELIAAAATPTLALSASWQVQAYPEGTYDSYPAASLDNAAADGFQPTLTVRAREQDRREPVPAADWRFAVCDPGKPPFPDDKHICYAKGFEPGKLYELTYLAKDPTVTGVGFAAARDLGAYLKSDAPDNPVHQPDALALLEGSSQSGRMIRSFLALGFNRDETGRRVFDAAYPHIGGGLMPLNVRFSQSLRAWGEQVDHLYPAYDFPFTYTRQTDPLTGRTQGIWDRCSATETCPKLFHVATALEMWEGRQSLGLTDPLGLRDVADPPDVRTFIMASTQHGPAPLPLPTRAPFGNCQQQGNPDPQTWTMRALMRRARRLGARRRGAAGQRRPAHRRRDVGGARSSALSRNSRYQLCRRGAAVGLQRAHLRQPACAGLWTRISAGRFQRRVARAAARGDGGLRRARPASRRGWRGRRRRALAVPACAHRHLHGLEPVPEGAVRERALQLAGQFHSLRRDAGGTARNGRSPAFVGRALSRQERLRRGHRESGAGSRRRTYVAAGGRGDFGREGAGGGRTMIRSDGRTRFSTSAINSPRLLARPSLV